MQNVLAVILAGGRGTRLEPLTRDRAKPAVPFGGAYRIIDFTLSNCVNSGLRQVLVFTQYKAMSLDRHLNLGWRFLCRELGEFIDVIPPQQRIDAQWYEGTANAVYQNIYTIEKFRPQQVLVLAGDHIYKMNYAPMIQFHQESGADLTIAALPVPLAEATQFGVMQVDDAGRVVQFREKPADPQPMPSDPTMAFASMGIYVFSARFLYEQLCLDGTRRDSAHDFGKDVIPRVIETAKVMAYPFLDENGKETAYWRDVGTLDAYFETSMDLVGVDPFLNLYDSRWPIRTHVPCLPPPKFVFNSEGRRGYAVDSIVCGGSILSGGAAARSIVGMNARINSFAHVEDSILFDGVDVGRHARIRRAIIDKGVRIPPGTRIGFDPQEDTARGFLVSEQGITVIPKHHKISG